MNKEVQQRHILKLNLKNKSLSLRGILMSEEAVANVSESLTDLSQCLEPYFLISKTG